MNQLLLVNESDKIIGYGEKEAIHNEGLLHRAFSIFVYHEKTRMILIQKRALGKYHSAGLWSNSCCSHPYKDETPIESYRRCLRNELKDELLQCCIQEAGSFKYYSHYQGNSEHECDHVVLFIDKCLRVPTFDPNPQEIESYRWATVEQIRKALQRKPDMFTSWFPQAFTLAVSCLNSIYLSLDYALEVHSIRNLSNVLSRPAPACRTQEFAFPYFQYYSAFDQGNSGYCWLITALYCVSRQLWKTRGCPKDPILFSKDRLIFFDKLEKANHFLNVVVQRIDASIDTKSLSYMLVHPMRDQGHWNMAGNLIVKYGLTPYDQDCDITLHRSLSTLNAAMALALRVGAYELRTLYETTRQMQPVITKKNEILEKIKQLMLDYWSSIVKSPLDLRSQGYVLYDETELFAQTVSISSGYGTPGVTYRIIYDGNVEEGAHNSFLELQNDQFQTAVQKEIDTYGYCQCSCDSTNFFDREHGHCGDSALDFSAYTNDQLYRTLNRTERMQYHLSAMSHAIVLLGSPEMDSHGLYLAYDPASSTSKKVIRTIEAAWFDKYVSSAVIHKDQIPPQYVSNIEVNVTPWDYFKI